MAGNYYDILGIRKGASDKEVRQAYRRLARRYHPDVNRDDQNTEARFKEVNEAYQVLSDKGNRRKYDRYGDQWRHAGQAGAAGARAGSPFTWFRQAGQRPQPGGGFDPGSEGLGDLLGSIFNRSRQRRTTFEEALIPQQVEVGVSISLKEAYAGTARTMQTPPDPITGTRGRRIEVKLPPGLRDGSRIHVGAPPSGPGLPLDIYVVARVTRDKTFERKGDDLATTVQVPLVHAMLGGEVEVPTIRGTRVALKLPPETQQGRAFRLKGQGMPRRRAKDGTTHGDLLATVEVVLPAHLSEEEQALFGRLSDLRGPKAGDGPATAGDHTKDAAR